MVWIQMFWMILLYLLVHSDPLFPHPCLHGSVIISILLAMVLHEEYIPFCIQQILKEFLHRSSSHFTIILSVSSICICLLGCVQGGITFPFMNFSLMIYIHTRFRILWLKYLLFSLKHGKSTEWLIKFLQLCHILWKFLLNDFKLIQMY